MSGICGILYRDAAADTLHSDFSRLLADLSDFGLEDHCWSGPGVVLGQRQEQIYRRDRLERQPVVSRNLVLIADARLLNPGALAESLGIPTPERGRISDSTLILESWLRWGEDALDRLEGEFCFAVWDTEARRLTLARDHLGNRPLYHALRCNGFAFSSSLSGLPRLPEVDTRLDDYAIADYLGPLATEECSTPYLGVRRLPPGSLATWSAGQPLKTRRYWDIARARHANPPKAEDYPDAVRERVEVGLAHCCDTDHGVGLILSGGLDSSTLAGLTARRLAAQGRLLQTASSVLPANHEGPARDERSYIEAVCAQHPNIVPHWVTADGCSVFAGLEEDLCRRGQPPLNAFAAMDDALHKTLAHAGVRVVIDGLQGDSTWSFQHPLFVVDFALQRRPLAGWRAWCAVSRRNNVGRRTLIQRALKHHRTLLASFRGTLTGRLETLVGPTAVASELAHRTRLLQRTRRVSSRGLWLPSLRVNQRAEVAHPLWPRRREEIARTGAAKGLSLRSPLWDRRVIELCLSAPPDALVKSGLARALVRDIGRDLVPEVVRTRTDKGAFLPNFHTLVAREKGAVQAILERAQTANVGHDHVACSRIAEALAELHGEVAQHHWTLDAQSVIVKGAKMAAFLLLYRDGKLFCQ